MPKEPELNPALQELERALGGLTPAPLRLERDRLLFRAGQESVVRPHTPIMWPIISALLAILLVASWSVRLAPRPVQEAALAPRLTPVQPAVGSKATVAAVLFAGVKRASPAENSYGQLRDLILARGMNALPRMDSGFQSGANQTSQSLNQEEVFF